jgi:hypothetical protein
VLRELTLPRAFQGALTLSVALAVVGLVGLAWAQARAGLSLEVVEPGGRVVGRGDFAALDATALHGAPAGSVARWRGFWDAGPGGERRISVRSDGGVRIELDGREVLVRKPLARNARTEAVTTVAAGPRPVVVELAAPARDLRVRVSSSDGSYDDLSRVALTPAPPSAAHRVLAAALGRLPRLAVGLAALTALLGLLLLARAPTPRAVRWAAACAVLLFAFGLALRFEALLERYWIADRPAWAEALRPALDELHPDELRWEPVEQPYEGDPSAYLRHARAMRSFYEARFREPLFVAAAKAGVAVAGGSDLGISLASMAFSALTVLAVYALGHLAFSPVAGLVAATALAADVWMIRLSVEGWRDDAFSFWVVVAATLALKVYDTGRLAWAAALGAALAAATLTRITALTMVVPVVALVACVPLDRPWRARARAAAVAALVCLALAGPFLVSCWIVYDDPFHSINGVAPAYYVSGAPAPADATVGHYLRTRLRPFEMLDSMLVGYTAYPFAGKWQFDPWWPPLGRLLAALSVVGALFALTRPRARVVGVAWAGALFPFVFTWRVPGGDAARLTTFAYPFYLVCTGAAAWAALRLASAPEARRQAAAGLRTLLAWRTAAWLGAALAALWFAVQGLHYLVTREALAAGSATTIAAGVRDGLLFGDGWSAPVDTGNFSVRRTAPPGGRLELPLLGGRAHEILLRMEPADPDGAPEPAVRVVLNDTVLGVVRLAHDPERMGSYTLTAPAAAVRDGANVLKLEPDASIALWYVRLTPAAP